MLSPTITFCSLLPAVFVLAACTSASPAADAALESSVPADAPSTDAPVSPIDAAADAPPADADAAAPVPDAPSDACVNVTYDPGSYVWGTWTCSSSTKTTDVRAFAISLGIQSVDEVFTGTNGVVNSNYAGTPACTMTTPLTFTYPSCGMVTSTSSTTYTCSASCAPTKCKAGTQASLVDTYALTRVGNTFTTTRTIDAAILAQGGLQKFAGCQVGDIEVATLIKQ